MATVRLSDGGECGCGTAQQSDLSDGKGLSADLFVDGSCKQCDSRNLCSPRRSESCSEVCTSLCCASWSCAGCWAVFVWRDSLPSSHLNSGAIRQQHKHTRWSHSEEASFCHSSLTHSCFSAGNEACCAVLCGRVQVAGLSLDGVAPFQAASLIAGPDDSSTSTPVSLIVRKADGQVVDLTVQRPARYLSTPVSSSLQQRYDGERIGVIRLTSFNARALRDVSAALDRLQQQGATEIVLDLRDNRCVVPAHQGLMVGVLRCSGGGMCFGLLACGCAHGSVAGRVCSG